jgi:hypothetical protein
MLIAGLFVFYCLVQEHVFTDVFYATLLIRSVLAFLFVCPLGRLLHPLDRPSYGYLILCFALLLIFVKGGFFSGGAFDIRRVQSWLLRALGFGAYGLAFGLVLWGLFR